MQIQEDQIPGLIRQGEDRKVIPLLYRKVLPAVERTVSKNSGRKEDAFDAFQDALMLFYKQVIKNSFDTKYKVYGYLYRMSINLWINKIKKDNRMELHEDLKDVLLEEPEAVKEELFAADKENILSTLFAGIGEKCIELLTYTIYYNLLYEDIILRMNFSSVDAVKMQVQRCKQKLMKEIEKNPELLKRLKDL